MYPIRRYVGWKLLRAAWLILPRADRISVPSLIAYAWRPGGPEIDTQIKEGWTCPKCKLQRGPSLNDPCIEHLPNVQAACCGHGEREGYIYFDTGIVIRMTVNSVEDYRGPYQVIPTTEVDR